MFRCLLLLITLVVIACSTGPIPTPTPTSVPPTPTPQPPAKVEFLTREWEREIRSLEARIERECTDTPERAANTYVCNGMQQVISLRRSNVGKTRAGVPVYTFRLNDGARLTEVTLAEVRRYLQQPLNDLQMWRRVEHQILGYERSNQ